ncbi:bifunctional [glutamate--ammonia ligase]-adenylyl-L-tyrosine phosphorylase/[glutamate--ammonia-ligase] adenylyltransferase [Psychrobium sp. 1_MG-2023]|uniref:bifunctional [glutamate--ammonia ligase]-adenylyl-L-tyrosine phosphorylase/[glutamate--ammonia-ligase] adenylyltransferase n=1 Tax=Psychrobium sp. 1_MG-2023 TaxID=3062624 RepID=UPI0026D6C183
MQMLNPFSLPQALFTLASERYYEFSEANVQLIDQIKPQHCDLILKIFALSDFAYEQITLHPQWLTDIFEQEILTAEQLIPHIRQRLEGDLATVNSEADLDRVLRLNRNFFQVVIAWRDMCQLIALEQSMKDVSALAEHLIISARDWLYGFLAKTWGTPVNADGQPQPLMIIGMGKLGGRELNFSSDIDLIFSFPEHGQTQGGRRSTENQQFFVKLGQKLINALDKKTYDGFVYRVDMRLRPFGNSGPLVVSYAALEDYYQSQGRDWERYAMVKGRVLGEQTNYSHELSELLRPFMFRRYIDFSAIESLRQMKQMISHEVRRRGLVDNIKLGSGGIREVEFIVQVFQMIRGGREPQLRQQSLLATLIALQELDIFTRYEYQSLLRSYLFLRACEQFLQQFADKQTQTLPENETDWARLVYLSDCVDEAAFREKLKVHTAAVTQQFNLVVGEDDQEQCGESKTVNLLKLIYESDADFDGESVLFELGCAKPQPLFNEIHNIKQDISKRPMGPRGQEAMAKLMPALLIQLIKLDDSDELLARIGKILSKIATRTAYIELLLENPGALTQFIKLCHASSWIAEQLTNFPILLDELLDPKLLYSPTPLSEYPSELRQYLMRVPPDDMEQMMEGLRQYKQAQQLRIAAADITGVMPVMEVSDHLTALAESIMDYVVDLAWQQMTERYGEPVHLGEGKGFAVIGYGKMGGLELGYGSDLDLVFVHCAKAGALTNGNKQVDSHHFYLKLAQRILHWFNTRTNSGILYEIDMRLRPSGNSGLMVSNIQTFIEYQEQEAWVWEHQAIVRARIVCGDNVIKETFNQARLAILTKQRDLAELQQEVAKMRVKMRDHLSKGTESVFDLKQDNGAIADIEFIAQYIVLGYSEKYPALATFSDNIRIFDAIKQHGILSEQQVISLSSAYCSYRDKGHRLVLQNQKNQVSMGEFTQEREEVSSIWRQVLLSAPSTSL